MLACAILPFLPLIVDAHIRQMHDDDPKKRQIAATFLHKTMRASRGLESVAILQKVKEAQQHKGQENNQLQLNGAETTKDRAILQGLTHLWINNELIDNLGFGNPPNRCVFVILRGIRVPHKELDKESWEKLKSALGDLANDVDYWGNNGHRYRVIFACKNITGEKLYRLHAFPLMGQPSPFSREAAEENLRHHFLAKKP